MSKLPFGPPPDAFKLGLGWQGRSLEQHPAAARMPTRQGPRLRFWTSKASLNIAWQHIDCAPCREHSVSAKKVLLPRRPERPRHGLVNESAMSNPWLKKNPFMSMWLSGANSVANSARGRIAAEAKRQSKTAVAKATNDVFSFWTGAMTSAVAPKRRKKR